MGTDARRNGTGKNENKRNEKGRDGGGEAGGGEQEDKNVIESAFIIISTEKRRWL